jgi:hypothetical protein
MGKRARVKARQVASSPGEVGPRQPCPCGSGRRYKACHGSDATPSFVARPFAGLVGEVDLVAMREFVPAATAPLRLLDSDRPVVLCTLLPAAAPALVRPDATVWLGLQVQHQFGDPSRDLAAVLLSALDAEPGTTVGLTESPGAGPRLQDLVGDAPLVVSVHEGFDFWVADADDPTGSVHASLETANSAANPTVRLAGVEGAYWTRVGGREYLRWVLPYEEERLLSALARLHAAGADRLVDDSRLVGAFRAHGLLVPVWDLSLGTGARALEQPAERVAGDLVAALDDDSPLTSQQRSARNGLANRQLTIR